MPKDTKSLGNNKAPACESRGFVRKKEKGVLFDTPSFLWKMEKTNSSKLDFLLRFYQKMQHSYQYNLLASYIPSQVYHSQLHASLIL